MSDGDRRRFTREPCLITVHLRIGTRIYEGTLVDISENGAFMATRRPLEAGAQVQVRFRHPRTEQTVTARALVVRSAGSGEAQGREAGLGLHLLDTLTDMEVAVATSSGSFPRLPPDQVEHLRRAAGIATAARPEGVSTPKQQQERKPAEVTEARSTRHESPPLQVGFQASDRPNGKGTLGNVSSGGLQVICQDPPEVGRLVRLEIVEGLGRGSLRIAGRVVWSSPVATADRPQGFGVRILHFLSAADERRFAGFLIDVKDRGPA